MTIIQCQQAIFTSIRSPTGGGYRLVATSSGLRPEEKKYITTRCPSHQGLCSDAPDAVGICAYQLPTGRYCITHTSNAGKEYSGRGGHRLHTHILALEPEHTACFHANPFALIRDFIQQGHARPQDKPPANMSLLQLTLEPSTDADPLAQAVNRLGPTWLAATLDCILQQESAVLLGNCDPLVIAEAMMLSLPVALRSRISFSAGLRYSLARGFKLAVINGQTESQIRPAIAGHSVSLLVASPEKPKPSQAKSKWAQLVGNHWQDQTHEQLLALTSERFPDVTTPALDGYARIALRSAELRGLDTDQIIQLLDRHLSEPVSDGLAASLADGITKQAVGRLALSLTAASIDELTARWDDLIRLWIKAERTAELFAQLSSNCLKRAAQLDPLASVKLAAHLVQSVQDQPAFSLLLPTLTALIDRLSQLLQLSNTPYQNELQPHLQTLAVIAPLADRITVLRKATMPEASTT